MEIRRDSLNRVRKLHRLYCEGKLKGPEKHEVNPGLPKGSRENYLYFTLPCCLNFQRSSPALWKSALDTFRDPSTKYVFFPEKVVRTHTEKVRQDLRRYNLAVQTNKHPAIWSAISHTLAEFYDNDPRYVLQEGAYDVLQITAMLQKEKKKIFPYLGGPKLSNYWLFILSRFTDVKFKNPEEISIIPDTHVIKSSMRLGLVGEGVSSKHVESVWRPILAELNIPPGEMHSALWRWSRGGFAVPID